MLAPVKSLACWHHPDPASQRCFTSPGFSTVRIQAVCASGISETYPAVPPDRTRTQIRRREIGFVYQFHHLLPEFTALENVILPQLFDGTTRKRATERARDLLDSVGLSDRADHRPAELSGGEQQRTAVCRALANSPGLLLADEPTGNLDTRTSAQVFDMLLEVARTSGLAAVIATHNVALAQRMDRTVHLDRGRIVEAAA